MYSLLVGIDVSKDSFAVAALDEKAKTVFSMSPLMNVDGFAEFLKVLTSHHADLATVIVALESTGPYHLNLYSYLVSTGIMTIIVNPLIIANFNRLSLRKTKTDRKDAFKRPCTGERIDPEVGRVDEERHQEDTADHLPNRSSLPR